MADSHRSRSALRAADTRRRRALMGAYDGRRALTARETEAARIESGRETSDQAFGGTPSHGDFLRSAHLVSRRDGLAFILPTEFRLQTPCRVMWRTKNRRTRTPIADRHGGYLVEAAPNARGLTGPYLVYILSSEGETEATVEGPMFSRGRTRWVSRTLTRSCTGQALAIIDRPPGYSS